MLAVGTLVAALATSIGRADRSAASSRASAAAIFPLAFGIIRDEFPPRARRQGIALISAILGIGGGSGIVLAGPIVDNLSYHWLFWIPLVVVRRSPPIADASSSCPSRR